MPFSYFFSRLWFLAILFLGSLLYSKLKTLAPTTLFNLTTFYAIVL